MVKPSLNDLIDGIILARIPFLHPENWQTFKLLAVEVGGIWVEGQSLTDWYLSQGKVATASEIPVAFLPYSQIQCILSAKGGVSLSEKSFGLE